MASREFEFPDECCLPTMIDVLNRLFDCCDEVIEAIEAMNDIECDDIGGVVFDAYINELVATIATVCVTAPVSRHFYPISDETVLYVDPE